jgi:uncharacterized protein (TIGR03067 family)
MDRGVDALSSEAVAQLGGTWVPVAAEVSGQNLGIGQLRVAQLIIDRDTYQIIDRYGQVVDCGQMLLDAHAMPCELDIVGRNGPNADKRLRAIIEFSGDRLRVCYDLQSAQRPRTMQAQADQLLLTITYERTRPALLH